MDFANSTALNSAFIENMLLWHTWPYCHYALTVRVRYSRGAAFSGTCYYATSRLFINLGRQTTYPYLLGTHIARARSGRTHWWRETYRLVITTPYQLVLFVYLHELYHWLVKAAGHNQRRKESMCDRFAARVLVDDYGVAVLDASGAPAERCRWDIGNVHAFVAKAPRVAPATRPPEVAAARPVREIPVQIRGSAE